MNDKRKYPRLPENLPARWEGVSGRHEAAITNVSLGGCHVETVGVATVGETIHLEMLLPTGNWLKVRGEVRYHTPYAGFGVLFWPLKPAEFLLWRDYLALVEGG